MRRRNIPVYVRVSADEHRRLLEKVEESGQTLQSYIIHSSLNGKISSADEVHEIQKRNAILEDIDKQLRGMGTNINQMARIANGQGQLPTINELLSISSEINNMRSEVNDEWQSTRSLISQQRLTER